jgi:transposase
MVGLHLARIDHLDQMLIRVKEKIGRIGDDPAAGLIAPFITQVELFTNIPGIGERVASVVISEIGIDGPVPHRQTPGRLGRAVPG